MTNNRCVHYLVLAFVCFFTVQNSQAAVFELDLYTLKEPRTITGNFFNDYDIFETCEVEIDDAVIKPNAFVEIHSDEFKRLTCTIKGNHGTYTFTYGSEIKRDYWRGATASSPYQYGLLFDSEGKPLRFDSPQLSTANLVGFYDTEGREEPDGTVNIVGAPFLDPKIHDTYDIPAAILLEPTVVNGVQRERGEWLRSDLVPPGASAALVNGEISFDEGFYDVDGNSIQGLKLGHYLSFDQKLRAPQVRITQAVFQDKNSNDPIILVHERTTAIIVNKGSLEASFIQLSIRDENDQVIFQASDSFFEPGPSDIEKIFYCDEFQNYCNLEEGKPYNLIISINKGGGNISEHVKKIKIAKTLPLIAPLVFLYHPTAAGCANFQCQELPDVKVYRNMAENFIQKIFPVPDDGFSLKNKNNIGNMSLDLDSAIMGERKLPGDVTNVKTDSCRDNNGDPVIFQSSASFDRDVQNLMVMRDFYGFKRLSVAVPEGYFAYHNFPNGVTGSIYIDRNDAIYPLAFAEYKLDTFGATLAQELAHTFGLKDSYDQTKVLYDPSKNACVLSLEDSHRGPRVNGFDVYAALNTPAEINNARDFMGAGNADKYWVSQDNWLQLVNAFDKDGVDPQLARIQFQIDKNGGYNLHKWLIFDGIAREIPSGGTFVVQTVDYEGNISSQFNFEPSYKILLNFGVGERNTALVSFQVPFASTDRYIVVKDDNGNQLFKVDAIIKVSNDFLAAIPDGCLINGTSDKNTVNTLLVEINNLSSSNKFRDAFIKAESLNDLLNSNTLDSNPFDSSRTDNCNYLEAFVPTRTEFLSISQKLVEILGARVDASLLIGDLDHDGDVDRDDLDILMAHRNQPDSGEDDPMDLDGDGQITGLDARILTQLCTRPRCATE